MEGYRRPNSLMAEPIWNLTTREANETKLIIAHG